MKNILFAMVAMLFSATCFGVTHDWEATYGDQKNSGYGEPWVNPQKCAKGYTASGVAETVLDEEYEEFTEELIPTYSSTTLDPTDFPNLQATPTDLSIIGVLDWDEIACDSVRMSVKLESWNGSSWVFEGENSLVRFQSGQFTITSTPSGWGMSGMTYENIEDGHIRFTILLENNDENANDDSDVELYDVEYSLTK